MKFEEILSFNYGPNKYYTGFRGSILVIKGLPGSGKTSIVKFIAAASISGKEIGGFICPQKFKIDIIDAEQAEYLIEYSKQDIENTLSIDRSILDESLNYFSISHIADPVEKYEEVKSLITSNNGDIVIIDNLSSISGDLNNSFNASNMASELNTLAKNKGKLLVLLSHVNEAGKSFGALGTQIENYADVQLYLQRDYDEGYTIVTNTKNRLNRSGEIPTFDFTIIDNSEIILGPYIPINIKWKFLKS